MSLAALLDKMKNPHKRVAEEIMAAGILRVVDGKVEWTESAEETLQAILHRHANDIYTSMITHNV